MKKIIYLLLLILMVACNNDVEKKKDRLTFVNNCEALRGFTPPGGPAYSIDYSNSGNYSNYTDSIYPWGVTFKEVYGKITLKNLSKVRLSAFGYYLKNPINCSYCISIDLDGKNLFWNEIPFQKYIKDTKIWTRLNEEVVLPKNIDPKSTISVFTWNKGKEPFYIDDYEIQFFE